MITGIGIDVVDLKRMESIIQKKPRFVKRVLTENEYTCFCSHHLSLKRQTEFLAGRFACKEAFSKAYGTGIGKVTFQELEILNYPSGQPYFNKSPFSGFVHVTLSHSETVAIAQVILEVKEEKI